MSQHPNQQDGKDESDSFQSRSHQPYESFNVNPEIGQVGGPSRSSYTEKPRNDGNSNWSNYGYDGEVFRQMNHRYERFVPANDVPPSQSTLFPSQKETEKNVSRQSPHRPFISTQKSSHNRWYLTKEFQDYVTNSTTGAILLLDDHHRTLRASKEMGELLHSLVDQEDVNFKGKLKGITTVSKNGRWLALVLCSDERTAKCLMNAIKDQQKDFVCKFVRNTVFSTESQSEKGKVQLNQSLFNQFSAERALIDEWNPALHLPKTFITSSNSPIREAIMGKISLPDSVSKDHRKITSNIPISVAKKAADHISRWKTQQEEIQGSAGLNDSDTQISKSQVDPVNPTLEKEETKFDYLDEEKKTCLLCQRQFKSLIVLRKHAIDSDLHKRNLQDSNCCSEGRKRKRASMIVSNGDSSSTSGMKKAGFTPVGRNEEDQNQEKGESEAGFYRDRAAERRIVFGTESIAKAKTMVQSRSNSSHNTKDEPRSLSPPPPRVPAKLDESNSKGGALLAKMGWSAGKGLGMTGEGRLDPVPAHIYVPGAGIGSKRGNQVALTVEEYSSKQGKFAFGDAASQRSARMRDRYEE